MSTSILKVGVDTRLFRGPATGVANYTLNVMLSALRTEPELFYIGFVGEGWRRIGCEDIEQLSTQQSGEVGNRMSRRLRALASRIPILRSSRALARTVMRAGIKASMPRPAFDLFHAFNFLPPFDPGVAVLPVVYDLSAFRFPEHHPPDRVKWLSHLESCVSRAPMVQTISKFSKREIVDVFSYPPERIFVVPPAAASVYVPRGEAVTSRNLVSFSLESGKYFLSVGTLEPRKNFRTLVRAYAELAPAVRAQYPLVIVGGRGWGDLNLPPQADSLRFDGSLRILEGTSNLTLSSLYEGARLVLMPSLYEGFGMPIVEAMACGAPVAFSAGSSMEEIASGFGRTAPPEDVDAWVSVMAEALSSDGHVDPGLRQSRIGRAHDFDWNRSAKLVLDVYREMILR